MHLQWYIVCYNNNNNNNNNNNTTTTTTTTTTATTTATATTRRRRRRIRKIIKGTTTTTTNRTHNQSTTNLAVWIGLVAGDGLHWNPDAAEVSGEKWCKLQTKQFTHGRFPVWIWSLGTVWGLWMPLVSLGSGEMEGCTGGTPELFKNAHKKWQVETNKSDSPSHRAHCWVICMTAMELGVVVVVVGAERGKTLSLLGFCARTESLAFPSYWVCWYFREVIMLMFKWCLMDSTL